MSRKSHTSDTKADKRRRKEQTRGRKKLKRLLGHGDLRFLILSLVAEKPRHGYDLIKEISDRVAGAYSPSPGVIYPTLSMLEDLGWVSISAGDGTKKLHQITEEGRLALRVNRPLLDEIFARMEEARAAQRAMADDDDEPPSAHTSINRARKAMKTALRRRADDETLSEEQVVTIVTALLDAADTIENA